MVGAEGKIFEIWVPRLPESAFASKKHRIEYQQ